MSTDPDHPVDVSTESPGVGVLWQWKRAGQVDKLAAVAVDERASDELRWWATRFLGSCRDDAAIEALIEVLSSGDESTRSQAARGLEKAGDDRAVPALVAALRDGDGFVRIGAAQALGAIGDVAAVPALLRVAETTSWPVLREWATDSLAKLEAHEAVPILIDHLRPQVGPEKVAARRWGRRLRWSERWAAKHLERIGTRDALEPLRTARRRDPRRRWIYSRAISAIERRHPS